jgi:hypothetical protein
VNDAAAIRSLGVVRVFGDHFGREWRKEGAWTIALCPFHEESSPSFKVGARSPHRATCFSCGVNGDVVTLTAKMRDTTVREALDWLADQYQIPKLSESTAPTRTSQPRAVAASPTPRAAPDRRLEGLFLAALEAARAQTAGPAQAYLESRGLPVQAPNMGCVNDPRAWWSAIERSVAELEVGANPLTSFWPWVQAETPFVLWGLSTSAAGGQDSVLTGLQGRAAGDVPKPKRYRIAGEGVVLFDGDETAIIVEGPTDAQAWLVARPHCTIVGVPGTQAWRPEMAELVGAHTRVIVVADNDQAGLQAADAWAHDLEHRCSGPVRIGTYPGGIKDGCELLATCATGGTDAPSAFAGVMVRARERGPEEEEPVADELPPAASAAKPDESRPGSTSAAPEDDDQVELSRGALAGELASVLEHISLTTLIEACHWWGEDKNGFPKRTKSVEPLHALTDLVVAWFGARGGRFFRLATGEPYLYFRRRQYCIRRTDPDWLGAIYSFGKVNAEDYDGKRILRALEQYALDPGRTSVEPLTWLHYDRGENSIRFHTGDAEDRVIVTSAGRVELETNGDQGVLVYREPTAKQLVLDEAATPARAAELLERHFVSNLSLERHDAALYTCWLLSSVFRHGLGTRAILFCQGAPGSGKSEGAKLASTLLWGQERLIAPTLAALRVDAAKQPMVVLDNTETRDIDVKTLQFLLLSATGATHKKRIEGTVDGVHDQPMTAFILLTAIEPPSVDELIQRTLTVQFGHHFHRPAYEAVRELTMLARSRNPLWSGLLRLYADELLPHLRRLLPYYQGLIPADHPKKRLEGHLSLIASIAEVLHQVRPSLWPRGESLLAHWLGIQEERSSEQALDTDPIVDALGRLEHEWNRVVERGDEVRRPAFDERIYMCKPLFLNGTGQVVDDDRLAYVTIGDRGAERNYFRVVGFEGDYKLAHRDLVRACAETRATRAFENAIKSGNALAARCARSRALSEAGWRVELVERRAKGQSARTYRFLGPQSGPDPVRPEEGSR